MRGFSLIIAFTLLTGACFSQKNANSTKAAKFLTRFPFKQFSGGVMIIRATLNDIPDSLNFILDTGSGGVSLDSTTCEDFHIETRKSDTTITGMGGVRKVNFVYNQQLNLPGLKVSNLNFHVNNYNVLSGVYGERIDGIIGYSFFNRYIVKINFDNNEVEVYSPGNIKYRAGGTLLRPTFTTLPIVPLHIRDNRKIKYNFYFDTGAGLCFLLSEAFKKDSNVVLKRRKLYETQAEGMGGRLRMQLTVMKQLKIGRYNFRSVPTFIYDDGYNVTSYPYVGGLLGNDILRRFNMVVNYPKREIHLLPNTHFKDPFDYAYTGMAIYYIDGRIEVDDVISKSPADKAGLQKGDILVGIENNVTNNIQQYRTLLQSPKQKLKLIVQRGKDVLELFIKPGSIL